MINDTIKYGFCIIINYGILYYGFNENKQFTLYVKVLKKAYFKSVSRSILKRIIKRKIECNLFKFVGNNVVVILNQSFSLDIYFNDLFFL